MKDETKTGVIVAAAAGAAVAAGTVATANHLVDCIFDARETDFMRKILQPQSSGLPPFPAKNDAVRSTMQVNAARLETAATHWLADAAVERIVRPTAGGAASLVGYACFATKPSRRWVILVHGYRGRHQEMKGYAAIYALHGFNVLMPDLRSHGESGGHFIGMGWTDADDVLGWARYLEERFGSDIDIVLHGHSMGAAAVLAASGQAFGTPVSAVVADSGYTSVWDELVACAHSQFHVPAFPMVHLINACYKRRGGFDLRAASMVDAVRASRVPTLIIHGAEDDFVPVGMAPRLFKACGASIKEMHVVPDAGHTMALLMDPEGYDQMVFDFLERSGRLL